MLFRMCDTVGAKAHYAISCLRVLRGLLQSEHERESKQAAGENVQIEPNSGM